MQTTFVGESGVAVLTQFDRLWFVLWRQFLSPNVNPLGKVQSAYSEDMAL